MRLSRFSLFITVTTCCLLILACAVHSAPIKERMSARIPAINLLKDKGIVGENNKGFLEFRLAKKSSKKLVADENKDRNKVYAAIGKKQGATAALVGQRRAKMIADKGKKGHWYQRSNGKWYKK